MGRHVQPKNIGQDRPFDRLTSVLSTSVSSTQYRDTRYRSRTGPRAQEVVIADQLNQIVDSRKADKLATGYQLTAGPLWHPDGHLLFADPQQSQVYRLAPGGKAEVARNDSGGASGQTLDAQGRVVACEGLERRVTRLEASGVYSPVAETWEGKRLNKPAGVVAHSDGSVYFTDAGDKEADTAQREIDHNGVYRVTSTGPVTSVVPEFEFSEYPNGLAFSPDESVLYVANTRDFKHISAYDVQSNGSLTNGRVLAFLKSGELGGVPDGIVVDAEGRVYYAGHGGLWVFDPSGEHLGTIPVPEPPSGCAWGGPDRQTMFITAGASVYSMKMKTAGANTPGSK